MSTVALQARLPREVLAVVETPSVAAVQRLLAVVGQRLVRNLEREEQRCPAAESIRVCPGDKVQGARAEVEVSTLRSVMTLWRRLLLLAVEQMSQRIAAQGAEPAQRASAHASSLRNSRSRFHRCRS